MENQTVVPDEKFTVLAESADYSKPVISIGLSFSRLIDEIVYPYEEKNAFFIDGVPFTKDKVKRIKIVRHKQGFDSVFADFNWQLRCGNDKKVYGEQYEVRMHALFRESGEDVTSQVIKAYSQKIKPSIKDYLPKREELISAALQLFIASLKSLGR